VLAKVSHRIVINTQSIEIRLRNKKLKLEKCENCFGLLGRAHFYTSQAGG